MRALNTFSFSTTSIALPTRNPRWVPVLSHGAKPVPATPETQLKVAETREEREAAFRLVHQVYYRTGLTPDNERQMRVMKHHLADDTEVMIAKREGKVVFTATLVRDGEHGIPMDSLFGDEVDAMRREGLRVAEVSCLASLPGQADKRESFDQLVSGISLLIQVARRRGVDRLLLAVHPRHAKVYERLFGCVRCSDVREYAAVKGNPAVLCCHDFEQLDRTGYPLAEKIYGPVYDPWQLDGSRMTAWEKAYFGQAVPSGSESFVPMAA